MVLVERETFTKALNELKGYSHLSVDTETTSLRPYHGGRPFSVIIGASPSLAYYFNFQKYMDMDPKYVLLNSHLEDLKVLFEDPTLTWYAHNAKFDLHMLSQEGLEITGYVWCTKAQGRVVYNEHLKYDLATSLKRIELAKDDAVEKYIKDKGLWEWVSIPGKKARKKNLFYSKVPADIIVPYGLKDATGTYALGIYQEQEIDRLACAVPEGLPTMRDVASNERRLTRTVFRMERLGVKIDQPYCVRAARYEADRAAKAIETFKEATGKDFVNSAKALESVFESDRERWKFTDKRNTRFDSDTLKTFENPVARCILEYRDAKSKSDFYNGFLYHADSNGIIHPTFNPDGAGHGRFSSSDPNLQNLTSEEGEENKEFLVRRAIVPRPDYIFILPDYESMEYKFMLDLVCKFSGELLPLAKAVKEGQDVHQATADIAKQLTGIEISRKDAKMTNFLTIYGGGDKKLAVSLKIPFSEARKIREAVRSACPELYEFIDDVTLTATVRKYIRNWLGRHCYFPNKKYCYRATNSLVAGGCADVMKVAMNNTDDFLVGEKLKSRLCLTIHDELVLEVHKTELGIVPNKVKYFMETAYPAEYVPLTTSLEWSDKSLADKRKDSF